MLSHLFKVILLSIVLASDVIWMGHRPAYGNALNENQEFPSIIGSNSFPERVRANIGSSVRHSFKLQVPSNSGAISQLNIQVPESLKPSKRISISDQFGQPINADLTIKGHTIEIMFPRKIPPGTTLNIAMNIDHILQTSNAWLYPISVKFAGYNEEIPIGTLQFRNY